MVDSSTIHAALAQLDTGNDKHWTSDGAPRMDVVERLVGTNVSRGDVRSAAPQFSRENPVLTPPARASSGPGRAEDPVLAEEPVEEDDLDLAGDPSPEPMDELERALAGAKAEYDEAVRVAGEARSRVELARARVDEVIAARESVSSPTATMQNIQQYLQRQKELREARGQARQILLDGGISEELLQQLVGRAPIDQAMARKRTRGTERPNRSVDLPGDRAGG